VEWCSGSETMEEIICRLHQREEAAIKRERAMAYAFSHQVQNLFCSLHTKENKNLSSYVNVTLQWRPNCSQYFGQASYSLGKESWGWSWTERWVAARPWEVQVRVQPSNTKKANGHDQKIKFNKMNYSESKAALAKPSLSNGKETGKGKENSTSGLSKNIVTK